MNPPKYFPSILVAASLALAASVPVSHAQTFIDNTFTFSFATGGATSDFNSTWVYWYNSPGGNTPILVDVTKDAGNAANSGSLKVVSPLAGGNQNVFFGTFASNINNAYDFSVEANMLQYSSISFDILVAPGTPLSPNGDYGSIGVGIINTSYVYEQFGTNVTIPATASSQWVHISVPVDRTQNNLTNVPGIAFDINSYGGYPQFTITNWIDNVTANAAVSTAAPSDVSILPPSEAVAVGSNVNFSVIANGNPPISYRWMFGQQSLTNGNNIYISPAGYLTVSNVTAANAGSYSVVATNIYGSATSQIAMVTVYQLQAGLNIVMNNFGNQYAREMISAGDTGYGFVGRSNVTYSWTIGALPPAGHTNFQQHFFLIGDDTGTRGTDTSADYNAPNVIFITVGANPDNSATMDFRWKTNEPSGNTMFWQTNIGSYPLEPFASLTVPSGLGTWSVKFQADTNVTIIGPNGATTNFVFPEAIAQIFADPLVMFLGAEANNPVDEGYDVVIQNFSAIGISKSFVANFMVDTNLSAPWVNDSADPGAIMLIQAATPMLTWANPAMISYGTALGSNQLNASANIPGAYAYDPTNGVVLNAGTNLLSVVFTPTDTADYIGATSSVSLVVSPAALMVTANSTNRLYGQTNPAFTGTIVGVTNGDNITATYSTAATINSPIGTYAIFPALVDPNGRLRNYMVTTNNGTLTVQSSTGNTVFWVGGSGDWCTAANWSTGALPGSNDDVVINPAAAITVTHSAGTDSVKSIQSSDAFVLSGGQLTVTTTFLASNTITLSGGTLQTATVTTTNGASLVVQVGGTLDGVTVNGVVDVGSTYSGAQLTVTNNLVLNGTCYVGNPTNSNYGSINFAGSQSLGGNGAVVFGASNPWGDFYANALLLTVGGSTLTIGSGVTVHGQNGTVGSQAGATPWGGPSNVAIINQGIISADVSGGTIVVSAQPFSNQGLLCSPTGTLTLAGTISGLGDIQSGSGPLALSGVLTNAGQTLLLNGATNILTLKGGTILGGTMVMTNGASCVVSSGTLNGMTVNGVVDVGSTYSGAQLTVTNNLVLNGTCYVGNPTNSNYGSINFAGSQSLGGNGAVVFGASNPWGDFYANALLLTVGGSTLTIGSGVTVHGQNGTVGSQAGATPWGGPSNVAIINQGIISADVSGGTIVVSAQPFSNQGLLCSPTGTLTLAGTISGLGDIQSGSGPLALSGVLTNAGQTLLLNGATNILTLKGGTILGGTMVMTNGASCVVSSGTLNGMTVNGVVDVGSTYSGAQLTVTNNLVLNGTCYVGNPTNSNYGSINFAGSQSLGGNGAVVFGASNPWGDFYANALLLTVGGSTLTIGSGVTVHGQNGTVGSQAGATPWGGPSNVAIINQGIISADVSGGTIVVSAQPFSNQGLLCSPTGTLTLAGTISGLGDIQSGSGPLALSGVLTNAGQTLLLNGATNILTLKGGTILGGTMVMTNGASCIVSSGTLNGMTVSGVVDVGNTYSGAQLTVTSNLVLNGMCYVGNPTNSNYGSINFAGSQSLGGNGAVVFGASNPWGDFYANALLLTVGGSTLTIGSGVTVHGQNGTVGSQAGATPWGGPSNVAIINQGIISADVSGGTIVVSAQPFSNQGLLGSLAGTLNLAGTISGLGDIQSGSRPLALSGVLTNTGTTLVLNGSTNTIQLQGGTILGGAVTTTNGASLIVNGSGTLDGVTVNGVLDVGNTYNGANLTVLDGLTLNGMALVGSPTNGYDNFGAISFSGSQTLGGNGTVVFGQPGNGSITGLRLVSGGTTLTIGSGITVRGQSGNIGYVSWWGGPANVGVINQGTISADVSGGTITVNAEPFTNQGLAQAINGGTLQLNGTWSNDGTLVESGGTINLGGSFSLASLGTLSQTNGMVSISGTLTNTGTTLVLNGSTNTIQLQGGTILGGAVTTTNGASLIVNGSGTLDGVTVNGVLDVGNTYNGANLTVLDGLTLNGMALVGSPTNGYDNFGAISFSGSQTLGGNGTVVFGQPGNGSITGLRLVSGGTTLTIGSGITVRGQSGNIGYVSWWGGPANVGVINQGTISADVSGGIIVVNAQPFSNVGTLNAPTGTVSISGACNLAGGAIDVGISGLSSFGQINFAGNASLAGTLGVSLENGFVPALGDQFQILSCPSESSTFSGLNVPAGISVNYSNTGVFLVVTGTVTAPPFITQQPINQTVTFGSNAVFTMAATGTLPLAYQWQFNGTNLTNNAQITGSQSNVLTLTGVTLSNAGTFQIIVTNAFGTTNAFATLTVNQATPIIKWANPAEIAYGTALSSNQLNASANESGSLAYNPPVGTVLDAGTNVLSVIFTPTDAVDYSTVTDSVSLVIVTCVSPPSGIVSWWPGNGNASDIVGGNSGILVGGVTFTNGEVGQAFTFDGVTGEVQMPPLAVSNLLAATFTVEFWARSSAGAATPTFGFLNDGSFNTYNPLASYDSWLTIGNGAGGYQLLPPLPAAPSNTWAHYAIECDGFNYIVYFNSVNLDSEPVTVSPASPSLLQFVIGQSGFSAPYDDPFNGSIDEFTIYNRALTSNEVAAIYSAGVAGKCTGGTAPNILTQPSNQLVPPGGTASFSVLANGSLPLFYQWWFNQTNLLAGATNASLTLDNVSNNLAGYYSVVVTNVYGAAASTPATLAILLATPALTWTNPAAVVYGTALSSNELNATASVMGAFSYTPTNGAVLNAGTNILSVIFNPTDAVDYSSATNSVMLVVAPAPLSLTASNATRLYGQPNPVLGGTLFGLVNGDSITATYSCSATASSLPGTYPILAGLIDPYDRLGNYSVTTNNGTLTVGAASPMVTWSDPSPITYGVALSGTQLDASANIPGSFAYSPATGMVLNVGTNTLTAVFTPADTNDYSNTNISTSLVVLPAPLTVTASNVSRLYGQTNPLLGGILIGVTNGDDITATYATTATSTSPAGTYPIIPTLEDTNSRLVNYTVTTNDGMLNVEQLTPGLTWTNPIGIVYGTVLSGTQLNATANVSGTPTYTPPAGTVLNAGTNTLTVVYTPLDTTNYTSATDTVSLVVAPAPLMVMANSATRVYGQANPTFIGILAGVVNGDNITVTYNCSAISFSPPGTYPIVPSLADPNHRLGNYSVSSSNGTLTVTAGPPPTFTGINPNSGVTNAETPVTITGSGFELGAEVTVAGQSASNVVVESGTQITATMPVGSLGATNVVIANPDGTTATLTNGFTFTGTPPSFLSQPADQSLVQGNNAVFSVSALYAASYQWQFNGGNLTDNGRITGSQSAVLTVPAAQYTDVGVYQVIITSEWGAAISQPATLSIIVPPTIGIPPVSQSVGVGGTAMFTVGVNGTAPFTYQWLLNGAPLIGATNATLTIANVQTSNHGQQYSVSVGNPAGSATSTAGTLTVLNYCANVQPSQAIYPMGSAVPLSVQTFNCSSEAPVPNSSATVWISNSGTTRSLPVSTGASGATTVNFVPLASEVGTCQVAATLPGQSIPAVQGTFTLVGMSLSQNSAASVLTPGIPVTNTITLNNLTGVALSGVSASVTGSAPDVQVTLSTPGTLAGNATDTLTLVMVAPENNAAQDQFYVQITTAQGTTNTILVTANVVPPAPQLVAIPASLSGTMVGGGQTLINFYVANTGGATSGPVQVVLPSAAWLTTVTPLPLPPIAPGQSNQVTLALTPAANLALGGYPGTLALTSSNADASVPFQFDCVSDLTGSLLVTVQDELSYYGAGSPNVSNATVTVTDFLTGDQVTNAVTGASGMLLFPNLTSAYYTVSVTAPDHGNFSTTMLLAANETNVLNAFLELNLVDYTWIVTPTTVPDHYTFTLQTTFATEVPWPVVTVNPGAIDLCSVQGSTQMDLTITNSGLIAAQGLNLYFGSNPDWSIQALATNLGDLLPESSLVVPVLITQTGSSTSVSDSIAAQLSYGVTTPTSTNSTVVPIYVFDANPADCEPQNPTPLPVPVVSGNGQNQSGGSGTSINIPSYNLQTPQSVLVEVKLQIQQSAVIARDAFNATLQLVNNAGGTVSNLSVNVVVYDASNNVANNLFGIPAPTLNGLNAVDGTGVLGNGATGSAAWIIVPATNAAPTTATPFSVGGSFTYVLNGEPVTVPLFPVPITVLPTPILNVDYFLQHDVYSDDPFTNVIYPSIPFALGLLVHNIGYGDANDFTITSAQPEIIQNSNDLVIAFQLIGSQEGTNQSVSPSFTMDFGDLGPQDTGDGLWYMTSTLEGQFIAFSATYQHVDDFGNTNTSVINSVRIHELNHVVEITEPTDDHLPDYLVNDTTNVDALPDVVYSSDGTTNLVTSSTNGVAIGAPSRTSTNITVNVPATSGWGYFEIVDPGNGAYPIATVARSDGEQLLVGPNVWQTPERLHMVPPKPSNLIHIFDYNSTGSYTVNYGLPVLPPTVTTLAALNITPRGATLNAIVNPDGANTDVYFQWGATTNYGNTTAATTLTESLNTAQAVAIAVGDLPPNSTNHFQAVGVNSAGTSLGADVMVVTPPLPPPVITQVTNRTIVDGQSLVISNQVQVATPPAFFSLDSSAPEGATISTNGVFKWTPACLQGSSTNVIKIWVTDSSTPPLSNSMSLDVIVGECVQLEIGSTVMQAGQTGGVTVTLLSTVGLTNLNWTLANPSSRFTNWVFASSNAAIASVNSAQTFFNLGTGPGQTLQSPALLGTLYLRALPGPSAFLSLVATNILGTKLNGSVDGNIASDAGRVVVIGGQPLLQPTLGSNFTRTLILYDNPGTNYELMESTNLNSPTWRVGASGTVTNLIQYFEVDPTAPELFFRAQ